MRVAAGAAYRGRSWSSSTRPPRMTTFDIKQLEGKYIPDDIWRSPTRSRINTPITMAPASTIAIAIGTSVSSGRPSSSWRTDGPQDA
jgi:hypothetical protein